MAFASQKLNSKFRRETDEKCRLTFQRELQVTGDFISRLGLDHELQGHQGCVNCLEWNDKGSLLASGSDDVQVIVWDPFLHRPLSIIRTGHQGNIFSVKFLPSSNDSLIVTGAADCKIRVHDINSQETTQVFSSHAGRVKRLAVAPTVPFMFWSAAEDGTIMQHDLRTPEKSRGNGNPQNVLINLNAHMGGSAEAKCLTVNPLRPDLLAVGANDPYVRLYDRRMLSCKSMKLPAEPSSRLPWEMSDVTTNNPPEDFTLPQGCVKYYIAGHLPQKQLDYKKRYRTLAATYVTFSPDGRELLVNLGGEQIYLFDINNNRVPEKFDISMVLAANGFVKEAACSHNNGFSLHKNGTTNGVSNGLHTATGAAAAAMMKAEMEVEEKQREISTGKRHKMEGKPLPAVVEALKKQANQFFEKEQYSQAIIAYNEAISRVSHASVLYGNRAAAFMKRKWDGDLYAALRDCHSALNLDPNHLKAHFRLARCLYELSWPQEAYDCLQQFKHKFPDYAKSHACEALDRDIKAALYSGTCSPDEKEGSASSDSSESPIKKKATTPMSDQEKSWRDEAYDYHSRFCGHCNTTTDIKEANFFGSNGQYIVAGSDDGSFFIWEKRTTNIVRVLRGDDSIVNCLQPHPTCCLLATSGIDPVVRLWSPMAEDGTKNDREVDNSDDAALANQKRMNADPLEVMLMNMGYRITGVFDVDEEEGGPRNDQAVQCRPS